MGLISAASVAAQRPSMPQCPELDKSSPAQLLKYLADDGGKQSKECMEFAIRRLGDAEYVPAIDVLIMNLEFESLAVSRGLPGGTVSIYTMRGFYPAKVALTQIGLPASDKLVAAIAKRETTDFSAQLAGEALLSIHSRDDPSIAVAALIAAADSTPDPKAAARLRKEARRMMSTGCPGEFRLQCEAALSGK